MSLFAARGGARRVVGIDMSELVPVTRRVIASNNMDKVISIVKGKAEEVSLPPDVNVAAAPGVARVGGFTRPGKN